MKTRLLKGLGLLILSLGMLAASAQTYTHPTAPVQSTFNGACLVSTCSGSYFDNGGAGGNYAASINNIYRTFCPNTAGQCLRAAFTSFSMNDTYFLCFGPSSCCDYLQILNGPAQNSPALYNNCTSSPGTITASNPSGCLTFRHTTDGSVQLAGWAATLSCVACGGGPAAGTNSDCANATPVCNNVTFNDASVGPGINAEGCSGCNTSEVYTNWYSIQIANSGTLAFTIDPANNSDDFDPVVYGPNVTCGALGTPIRCSYAAQAGNGNTGLGNGAVDPSEGVAGDQWVSPVNVVAGETYYVLINGWSAAAGSNGFQMNWTGTAGLTCSILAAELTNFEGSYLDGMNDIYFSTAEESGAKSMVLERLDPTGWRDMVDFKAAGNNSMYFFTDRLPLPGENRYRVRIVEANGIASYSDQITVLAPLDWRFEVYPNPATEVLNLELYSRKSLDDDFVIVDAMGRTVHRQAINADAEFLFKAEIDLKGLAPGVYFARFGRNTRPFSKM
jgi:hypothetical protein